ncbi:toll/interleukin-1 receptor domain-containing protein [Viridibacillus sp. FSL H8-0123]|uniref:toll/interleukin-1 receptor domain-containing protein n=1 Tax=Viridibacillus sp. FSL H8-0123 TaxID=1928922 RepID=UPI00096CED34|nr:toll/interleukin-1 receptor domain-containing protein [Viridibacillus sp. FSL H8-0123]OMC78459.1 hypothetical protein BK130_19925 [Viridibacillus sp. FSL H8-0123]
MFRGYNLDLSINEKQSFLGISDQEIEDYEKELKNLKSILKSKVTDTVVLPREKDGKIDGSKLINDWFPGHKSDVFISHSHNDTRTAKRLAVWLNKNFGLTVFIDSIVWGSANELLKGIDNEHSVLERKDGNITYNYNTRNYTTSHVHMMLSTALNDIIDQTECLIFLNTPESLSVNEAKDKKTNSPWIYNELKIASIVRKIDPRKLEYKMILEKSYREFSQQEQRSFDVLYHVDDELSKMESLNTDILQEWLNNFNTSLSNEFHALDILYFGKEVSKVRRYLVNDK